MSKEYISLIITLAGYVLTLILTVIKIVSAIKTKKKEKNAKDWEQLKEMLTQQVIPLMEQAENVFDVGEEKKQWVIQKLSNLTHIDFFKYANILELAENIIDEICKTTKIEVNKNKVYQEKEIIEEKEESSTNGVF